MHNRKKKITIHATIYHIASERSRGILVNSRKLVNMFFKTVLIGGVVGLITNFIVSFDLVMQYINPFNGFELVGLFLYYLGFALTFAVVSLAGFLAYVFINQFGESLLRKIWPIVQVLLVAFVLFDIVYFSNQDLTLSFRIITMLAVLVAAIIIAILKVKQTNKAAFIPALFFMVVITTLELTLGLRTSAVDYIVPMLVTLIAANGYQLMAWHHVTKRDEEHIRRVEARRKQRKDEREKALKSRVQQEPNKVKKVKNKRK